MSFRIRKPTGSRSRRFFGQDGAATVELGVVAPLLLTLILGGIDFGSLLTTTQAIAAATRVGAQYARNSPVCQSSTTGIKMLPTPSIGATCTTNIQQAMQNSGNFSPALTFPDGFRLECWCDGDHQRCSNTEWMPASYSCTNDGRGYNQIFIRVTARQAIDSPTIPWPGFPTVRNGFTLLQLQ